VQPLKHITDGREDHPDLPCFLACDPKGEAVRKLALVHAAFGKIGKTLAVPANILVDKTGMVRWAHYAEIVSDRPDPKAVLAQLSGV
jgi:peroxiredoxin